MKLMNRDMTREKLLVNVTNNQIYVKVLSKVHGKWRRDTFFKSYDFDVDSELIESTVNYIKREWGLKDPKVVVVVE